MKDVFIFEKHYKELEISFDIIYNNIYYLLLCFEVLNSRLRDAKLSDDKKNNKQNLEKIKQNLEKILKSLREINNIFE